MWHQASCIQVTLSYLTHFLYEGMWPHCANTNQNKTSVFAETCVSGRLAVAPKEGDERRKRRMGGKERARHAVGSMKVKVRKTGRNRNRDWREEQKEGRRREKSTWWCNTAQTTGSILSVTPSSFFWLHSLSIPHFDPGWALCFCHTGELLFVCFFFCLTRSHPPPLHTNTQSGAACTKTTKPHFIQRHTLRNTGNQKNTKQLQLLQICMI